MFDPSKDTYRILTVEYVNGEPMSATVAVRWVHSDKPWFKPGRDRPSGWATHYFGFAVIDGTLWWHESGMSGGKRLTHTMHRIGGGKPWRVNRTRGKYQIWAAGDVRLVRWESDKRPEVPLKDDELPRMGWDRIPSRLMVSIDGEAGRDPFKIGCDYPGHFVWCKVCQADILDEYPCEHLEWCDECCCLVYIKGREREDSDGVCECETADVE